MSDFHSPVSLLEIQVDGQTPESWSDIVAQFADASIYQSWAYGAVRWGANRLSHLVMRREGQVVAAAQLRIARLPVIPAGVAYLRWGPMCQRLGAPLDPAVVTGMMDSLRTEYARRRGLALEIIPHAYPAGDRAAALQSAFRLSGMQASEILGGYRTVVVDLTPPGEVMRKNLDKKWRNQLNGAEKNGLVLEVADSQEAYREFLRLYEGMMARKQFETSVDVGEFGRMQELLPPPAKMQIFLARKDGEAIGALVCSLLGDTAIYLLGATNEKARELKAAYFLQWQAMLWLKGRGARDYDLGGIDPETNPGGYHFKSGFGGRDVFQVPPASLGGGLFSRGLTTFVKWRRHRPKASKQPAPSLPASHE